MTNSKSREEAISKLYDDVVFNIMFAVDESREIVKNYLAELYIRDGVNETIISNLQSSLYPRVLQGYRKDKRDLQTMD